MNREPRFKGRSTLLRAGMPPIERRRNRLLRYSFALVLAGLIFGLVLTIRGQLLATEGIGRLLYLAHDFVWLPLYGRFWTSLFPDALIWLTIAVAVTFSALLEFLGIASPLRRFQVAILKIQLHRFPHLVLLFHQALRSVGLRSGLAEQVLRDLRDQALHPFTSRGVLSANANFDRLCHLQALQIAFGLQVKRDLVAVVEILGLSSVEPDQRHNATSSLRNAAANLKPPAIPFWSSLMVPEELRPDLASVLQAASEIKDPKNSPAALASRTVQVAVFLATGGDAAALTWFDTWARLRLGEDANLAARLAEAEALCAFEYWAALAETHADRNPAPALLAEAFENLQMLRPRGERLAADAVLSGGVQ